MSSGGRSRGARSKQPLDRFRRVGTHSKVIVRAGCHGAGQLPILPADRANSAYQPALELPDGEDARHGALATNARSAPARKSAPNLPCKRWLAQQLPPSRAILQKAPCGIGHRSRHLPRCACGGTTSRRTSSSTIARQLTGFDRRRTGRLVAFFAISGACVRGARSLPDCFSSSLRPSWRARWVGLRCIGRCCGRNGTGCYRAQLR